MHTRGAMQSIAGKVTATVIVFLSSQGNAAADGGGYESDQGTRVFGTMDQALEGGSIPFKPSDNPKAEYESLRIDAGHLMVKRKGKPESRVVDKLNLVGTTGNGQKVTLVIQSAGSHKNIYDPATRQTGEPMVSGTETVWEYRVTTQDGRPLCDTEYNKNAALVVPAAWKDGQLSMSTEDTGFTFACVPVLVDNASKSSSAHPERPNSLPGGLVNSSAVAPKPNFFALAEHYRWHGGVAAKCIDLHYAPWAAGEPKAERFAITGNPISRWTGISARGLHNVCVQAMTADYAGDGHSYTVPGTRIALFDLAHAPLKSSSNRRTEAWILEDVLEQQYDNLIFEGVWREDIAKGKAQAICLAKVRWQTLGPSEKVFESLRNPLQATPDELHVCEKLTLKDLDKLAGKDGLLLISYSAINDRGLYWFSNGAEGIMTTRVKLTNSGIEPEDGLTCAQQPCVGIHIGNIVSADAPHDKLDPMVPIFLYERTKGEYLTTNAILQIPPWNEYHPIHDGKPEGYLFIHPIKFISDINVRTPELSLWRSANNDSVSYCVSASPVFSNVPAHSAVRPGIIHSPSSADCKNGYMMKGEASRQLGFLLFRGFDIPKLASTFAARSPVFSGPDPVERFETREAPQQLQTTKAMRQTPAAPAAHAPAAMQQTPQ